MARAVPRGPNLAPKRGKDNGTATAPFPPSSCLKYLGACRAAPRNGAYPFTRALPGS